MARPTMTSSSDDHAIEDQYSITANRRFAWDDQPIDKCCVIGTPA